MKKFIETENYTLFEGKMEEVLRTFEPNSIDSIVCDPPYDLVSIQKRFGKSGSAPASTKNNDGSFARLSRGFMGKQWDGTGVAFKKGTWEECFRVLKPGAYLLAFGGSRTFHRMACAIEDAGFEIRDTIMWLYGSGFPKSQNVGKQIDALKFTGKCNSKSLKEVEQRLGNNPKKIKQLNNGLMGKSIEVIRKEYNSQNAWSGYGTCLKPAYEPIIMARKPIEKTIAYNCLKYGVGAINIDECRVGDEIIGGGTTFDSKDVAKKSKETTGKSSLSFGQVRNAKRIEYPLHEGRFPSNIITDGSEEVAIGMPETNSGSYSVGSFRKPSDNNLYDLGFAKTARNIQNAPDNYGDQGSAMRYFYCAKASKKDRDSGLEMYEEKPVTDGNIRKNKETGRMYGANTALRRNNHPTVKPVELMQYLIRLVTPRGGLY